MPKLCLRDWKERQERWSLSLPVCPGARGALKFPHSTSGVSHQHTSMTGSHVRKPCCHFMPVSGVTSRYFPLLEGQLIHLYVILSPPISHDEPSILIPEILLLIKQIGPGASQVDDFGTAVTILFEAGAFETVKGVRDAFATADDAFVLVVAERTFVADAHQRGRSHVAIAHRTFAIAFVAQSSQTDAGRLSTHD